ncbi:MAG: hypothetical protein J1F07_07870 [Muribaculaceae bacterium]|nr:hypothetical protein [Muribaculaceae bacterium]
MKIFRICRVHVALALLLVALPALTSCRTHRENQASSSVHSDSLTHVESRLAAFTTDSLLKTSCLTIDSLEVRLVRGSDSDSAKADVITVRMKGIRSAAQTSNHHQAVESRWDTAKVATTSDVSASSQGASTSTVVASPPNLTLILLIVGLVAAALLAIALYFSLRRIR